MTHRLIVQKYGGSSVADVASLHHVADRVVERKKQGYDVVVVVSAMGNSTDDLLTLAQEVCPTPPRRELDMLLTAGERISMSLLSMAIQDRGFDAISFTGSQSGILTNDRHVDARIIEVRPIRIQDELERGRIVIVAGFQGMSYKREVTTLGRGGSDTTAIALAAALDAEACEIYSDVDGVYNADPRAVPEASRLNVVDFETMLEMARFGAKVLHAEAVEFARERGIALLARATRGGAGQTLVRKDLPPTTTTPISAIACLQPLHWLTSAPGLDTQPLLDSVLKAGLSPLFCTQLNNTLCLALNEDDQPDVHEWLQTSQKSWSIQEVAAVSVIGHEITADPQRLLQMRSIMTSTVKEHNPLAFLQSSMRCTWIVPVKVAVEVQRALAEVLEL